MRLVRVGCSGWNYDHWRNGVFYPPRCPAPLWLDYYARHFDTVEVNATFYRLPKREVVANWVKTSPPGFVFAVKMSRYITHIKRLLDLGSGVRTFYDRIDPLVRSPKLGPVLWQLPARGRDLRVLQQRLGGIRDQERTAAEGVARGLASGHAAFRRARAHRARLGWLRGDEACDDDGPASPRRCRPAGHLSRVGVGV